MACPTACPRRSCWKGGSGPTWYARRCSACTTGAERCSWPSTPRDSRSWRSRPRLGGRPRRSSRCCRAPAVSSGPSCGLTFRPSPEVNAVSRPTPDRPDSDEDVMSRLVSEAGDPQVEPRPEHVADLRALILDRLGPPRTDRPSRTRWLVVSGLAAACLVAVLAWPPGDGKNPVPGFSEQKSSDPITPRPRQDPASVATWGNVRRG